MNLLKLLEEVEDILLRPKATDTNSPGFIKEIENCIGLDIPNEVINLLLNSGKLPLNISDIFLGYAPISLNGLLGHYRNKEKSSFFKGFAINESFIASKDYELIIFENQFGEVEDETIVDNISRVVPLFNGGAGFFIALFYNAHGGTEIVIITQDYGICTLAPNLLEHIYNLKEGIAKDIYQIDVDNNEIIFPTSWYQRVNALSDKGLSIDEWNT